MERSQAEIDAGFTLDSVLDLASVVERRRGANATAAELFPVKPRLRYGDDPDETLDLYPAQGGSAPSSVLVFIHGGFWSMMAANEFAFLARGFVPFGVALAVLDYPLVPRVRLPDIVASCRRAVAWLHREGATHGLDPTRLFVAGNSAGGHLTAEVMDRAWLPEAGLPADTIKGGTAISGLYDLAPVAASFRNDVLQLTPQDIVTCSPLTRAVDIAAPLIVTVGGDETSEFLTQTAAFAASVFARNSRVKHRVEAGTNHITVVLDAMADPSASLNQAVRQQITAG